VEDALQRGHRSADEIEHARDVLPRDIALDHDDVRRRRPQGRQAGVALL
jgi:hypothetical protein